MELKVGCKKKPGLGCICESFCTLLVAERDRRLGGTWGLSRGLSGWGVSSNTVEEGSAGEEACRRS